MVHLLAIALLISLASQGRAWQSSERRVPLPGQRIVAPAILSSNAPPFNARGIQSNRRQFSPASQSRLFSANNMAANGVSTAAAAAGVSTNWIYRVPVLGAVYKLLASSFETLSRAQILNVILVTILARMWWKYSVPLWLKRNVYKILPKRWVPAKQLVTGSDRAAPEQEEAEGLFSLPSLASKLGNLFAMAEERLKSSLEGYPLQGALLTTLQIMEGKKDAADEWNDYYASSGEAHQISNQTEILDGLHLSDWAYLEETSELRRYLQGLNLTLIRHVKTDEPGRVSHYVAINPNEKQALIVVKGTSALNDLITDACGVPVRHNLTRPYRKDASQTVSCHEGILQASLALTDDIEILLQEFFIPSGYHVRLMGHSLGAGVASLAGLFLKSRLDNVNLDVLAYAPPPVLNYEASVACQEFCTSIVNNVDVVPRASLFNLVALMRFLSIVDERLVRQNLSPTGPNSLFSLWQALQKDKVSIMSSKEVVEGLRAAATDSDLDDMDHLFVPGKVLMLYRKVKPSQDKDESTIESSAVLSDGTCPVLKIIDLDGNLLADHMPNAYEATLMGLTPTPATT